MSWRDVLTIWHHHLDHLRDLFPYTDETAMARFRGNKLLLATYIADTHDLTLTEGVEAIDLRLVPRLIRYTGGAQSVSMTG